MISSGLLLLDLQTCYIQVLGLILPGLRHAVLEFGRIKLTRVGLTGYSGSFNTLL
jgi:hypothetical protein